MSKLIKISLIIIFTFGLSAAVAKLRKIPAPVIDTHEDYFLAAGSIIKLKGKGFIKDFTKAHKIILKKGSSKKKIKIEALSSSQEELELVIPENITLGDYDLYIFLKTKFFKSKKQRIRKFIKVRPKAPEKPQLKFQVIKTKDELIDIIDQNQEHELVLNLEEELEPGKNTLTSFYYQDGYRSLASAPIEFYFLEESKLDNKLEISSELPLESYARFKSQEKLEVSAITQQTQSGLKKIYHLKTPSDNLYLATQIQLSPIYIKEAHVKTPEYLIIKNRDDKVFDLTNCQIKDEITTRYNFEDFETLPAQTELKIEGKLSLNDTGDVISIICDDKIIDSLEYTKADAAGFAL